MCGVNYNCFFYHKIFLEFFFLITRQMYFGKESIKIFANNFDAKLNLITYTKNVHFQSVFWTDSHIDINYKKDHLWISAASSKVKCNIQRVRGTWSSGADWRPGARLHDAAAGAGRRHEGVLGLLSAQRVNGYRVCLLQVTITNLAHASESEDNLLDTYIGS